MDTSRVNIIATKWLETDQYSLRTEW